MAQLATRLLRNAFSLRAVSRLRSFATTAQQRYISRFYKILIFSPNFEQERDKIVMPNSYKDDLGDVFEEFPTEREGFPIFYLIVKLRRVCGH